MEDIIKKYGDVVANGKFFIDNPKQTIPLSPALDIALGGGIREGSFVIFTGPPKTGKSLTALHFGGTCQQRGRRVFYLNIEGRLKERDLAGIKHLDVDKLEVIRSVKGRILTAENYLEIAKKLANDEPECIIILDSISQLCTEKEMSSEVGDVGRNNVSISLGTFCRQLANITPINNNIIIAITHIIANTSGFGSPFNESGGNKIKFASDIKLRVRSCKDWKVGEGDPFGLITTWETETTAGNVAPGRKVESYIRFGLGIDEVAELAIMGVNMGFIEKKGAWNTISFLEDKPKVQGQEGVIEFLRENQQAFGLLREKIQGMFG